MSTSVSNSIPSDHPFLGDLANLRRIAMQLVQSVEAAFANTDPVSAVRDKAIVSKHLAEFAKVATLVLKIGALELKISTPKITAAERQQLLNAAKADVATVRAQATQLR